MYLWRSMNKHILETQNIKFSTGEYHAASFSTMFIVADLPDFTMIRRIYSTYSLLANISTID